ncbi:unnamed protein product [Brassica oleracea]
MPIHFGSLLKVAIAQDISGNHVGLNINSMTSTVVLSLRTLATGFRKESGERRNRDNSVRVTLAPENMKKPKRPLFQGPRELNDVLLQNSYVGYAGMGRGVERHDIWSWSFENAAMEN